MNGKKRDPNRFIPGIKHGRNGYKKGCSCLKCVTDEKRYQTWFTLRQKGVVTCTFEKWKIEEGFEEPEVSNVTQLRGMRGGLSQGNKPKPKPAPKAAAIGEVETAVIEECDGLSMAKERPAMVAAAKNMARILDDPKKAALHATANRQMTAILNDLRGGSKRKTKGRLAAVQKMTAGTKAVGG